MVMWCFAAGTVSLMPFRINRGRQSDVFSLKYIYILKYLKYFATTQNDFYNRKQMLHCRKYGNHSMLSHIFGSIFHKNNITSCVFKRIIVGLYIFNNTWPIFFRVHNTDNCLGSFYISKQQPLSLSFFFCVCATGTMDVCWTPFLFTLNKGRNMWIKNYFCMN